VARVLEARVIANFGAAVAVVDNSGVVHQAMPLSKLPQLVAGDKVVCEAVDDASAESFRVVELLERSSVLARPDRRGQQKPLAANLTHLAIVSAPKPGIDTLLIDQFCIAAEGAGIDAMIVINKADLLEGEMLLSSKDLLDTYNAIGYPTVLVDTKNDGQLEPLTTAMAGKTVVLVGASGVGKSSIVQSVLPDLEVRVGAISEATGQGAHTTSVTFWYALGEDSAIIDSPGVRQFSVSHLTPVEVRSGYREMQTAAADCRFANCAHVEEPGCAVKAAVEAGTIASWRYDNYRKLVQL